MTLDAKMIGITPALLTRSGMCVLAPPYIRRPTMRFAYWTGILRVAWVMRMTAAMTRTIIATTNNRTNSDTVPARKLSTPFITVFGMRRMMLMKMMSEMPLPVVWVMMVENVNRNPGCGTIESPCDAPRFMRNTL